MVVATIAMVVKVMMMKLMMTMALVAALEATKPISLLLF